MLTAAGGRACSCLHELFKVLVLVRAAFRAAAQRLLLLDVQTLQLELACTRAPAPPRAQGAVCGDGGARVLRRRERFLRSG
jgi:hypothetical protein